MLDKKLLTQREYNVVKSNALIQKSRYDLSLQEQKIVLRLIQMIAPTDTEFREYQFSLKSFCEFCGITDRSGKNYENIKQTIKCLADKSYWIKLDNGSETLMRWIEKPVFNPKNGLVSMKIDAMMRPYLLELRDYFTQYSLYYTIAMRSKYSIRLYELLKSYQNLRQKDFALEELKNLLMAETYTRWADLKRKVIDVSVKEINLLSDIFVKYELVKDGRQFTSINFLIRFKKDTDERIKAWTEIENRLGNNQIKSQLKLVLAEIMPADA